MSSTIPTFQNLLDFTAFHDLELTLSNSEFTIQSLKSCFRPKPIYLPPHRTNFFTILLFEQAVGTYSVDRQRYQVQDRSLCITTPGRLKSYMLMPDCRGYVMTVSGFFLKKYLPAQHHLSFLYTESIPMLSSSSFSEFVIIAQQMLQEHQRSPLQNEVVGGLLSAFLHKVKRVWLAQPSATPHTRLQTPADTFKRLLEQHWMELEAGQRARMPNTQAYAELLHLHPKYFSRIVQHHTGKTPRIWVRQKQIEQAQSLLTRTSLTVKEIAYQTGFAEPGHFHRSFRKYTGITPTQYRKQTS